MTDEKPRALSGEETRYYFSWTSCANAYLWDGKPKYQTNSMYGH